MSIKSIEQQLDTSDEIKVGLITPTESKINPQDLSEENLLKALSSQDDFDLLEEIVKMNFMKEFHKYRKQEYGQFKFSPEGNQKIIEGLQKIIADQDRAANILQSHDKITKEMLIERFYRILPELIILLNSPEGYKLLDDEIKKNNIKYPNLLVFLKYVRDSQGLENVITILKQIQLNYPTLHGTLASLVNMFEAEILRDKLNNIFLQTSSEILKANINYLLKLLNPEPEGKKAEVIHKDLRDQYNAIDFKEYDLNKIVNEMELDFLKGEIKPEDKTLDLGCGTGRHLIPLKKTGYQIDGLDYVPKHVTDIKKENPDIVDLDVREGNWLNTPYDDKSYQNVFILGRSILHEFRFDRQLALFSETNRILKTGGKFIFDIPNREVGIYRERVADYKNQMKKRNIKYFRNGTIYDAPDKENYITRYAFSQDDIRELARLTGFKIVSNAKKEQIKNEKAEVEIENIYYVLEKVENSHNT